MSHRVIVFGKGSREAARRGVLGLVAHAEVEIEIVVVVGCDVLDLGIHPLGAARHPRLPQRPILHVLSQEKW